ncbi:MAG: hypothetical protein R3Y35_07705 [Clostridia bacterium]
MYKDNNIEFEITQTKISISFWFVASLTLMFLLDNGYNALMSLISIIIHELFHILFIYFFGGYVELMKFSLIEINIKTKLDMLKASQKFTIALAGPLSNICLYIVFKKIYNEFAIVNLAIASFQLLPINTLDGDKALEALGISNKIRQILSIFLTFLFALLGFYILLITKYNFSVLVISLFLLFSSLTCKN